MKQFAFALGALVWGASATADETPALHCLPDLAQRAAEAGVDQATIDRVLPELKYQAQVIKSDRGQPEFVFSFGWYFKRAVSQTRIDKGRALYTEHRRFLDQLSKEYGIPGQILVAFWGLETNFGSYKGNTPTLDALATLACDPRRSEFFSKEFVAALRLLPLHGLQAADLKGSWAGAIGHTQFMPSNYLRYGKDGDGDGRVDLLGSIPDALTSAAHFLKELGWKEGLRWGREVKLPKGFAYEDAVRKVKKPLSTWADMGVIRPNGWALPQADLDASILVPAGHKGPAFVIYDNFRVIMRWNWSESYALSVGYLADQIAQRGELYQQPPDEDFRISFEQAKAVQVALNDGGFKAGKPDGIVGGGTRAAIRRFQVARGLVADGYLNQDLLKALNIPLTAQP